MKGKLKLMMRQVSYGAFEKEESLEMRRLGQEVAIVLLAFELHWEKGREDLRGPGPDCAVLFAGPRYTEGNESVHLFAWVGGLFDVHQRIAHTHPGIFP